MKKKIMSVLLACVLLATVIPAVSASSVSVSNGSYYIVSALADNKVVDIEGGSTADGANVQLYDFNATSAQIYVITGLSNGWFQIKNLDGKVLDVSGAVRGSGVNVIQWSWNSGANQWWRFISAGDGYYFIQNNLGYYLDVSNGDTANGANIWVYQFNGTAAQKFRLVSTNGTTGNTSYVKTSGGNLNVRSGPGTSFASLGQLSNGAQVTVYNISNGWASISYNNNKIGYVSSAYLTTTPSSTSSSSWQYPVFNSYVCGNDWSQYYAARASVGRPDHAGIDIKSSTGNTAIYAAADGTIVASGYNSSNGNFVIIQHTVSGKTVYSFYAHLSKITKSSGWVAKGTQIGVIGNTGSSSAGIHLHFAIVDGLSSTGGYYGYVSSFTGDMVYCALDGRTYYNPHYVVSHGTLPN